MGECNKDSDRILKRLWLLPDQRHTWKGQIRPRQVSYSQENWQICCSQGLVKERYVGEWCAALMKWDRDSQDVSAPSHNPSPGYLWKPGLHLHNYGAAYGGRPVHVPRKSRFPGAREACKIALSSDSYSSVLPGLIWSLPSWPQARKYLDEQR